MKRVAVLLCLILIMVLAVSCTGGNVEYNDIMMGTNIALRIEGRDAMRAKGEIVDMIESVDSLVSTSREGSTIARINSAKVGESIVLDEHSNVMISVAYDYYVSTGGLFDISVFPLVDLWSFSPNKVNNADKKVPSDEEITSTLSKVGLSRAFTYDSAKKTITKNIDGAMLDLGAIAKGYIADKAKEILDQHEIDRAIIDIGRTLYLYGDKTYRVGISHPRPNLGEDLLKVIECQNVSVSTSGDYERYFEDEAGNRYHHIINPITGTPEKNGVISVSIECTSGMHADILSTSVFLMGEEQGKALLRTIESVSRAVIVSESESGLSTDMYVRALD